MLLCSGNFCQVMVISFQVTVICCQVMVISFQVTVICCQVMVISFQVTVIFIEAVVKVDKPQVKRGYFLEM